MHRPNTIAFAIGATVGLLLTFCYFTMGGGYFLRIPIEIIFLPGVVSEKLTNLLGLDEYRLGTIMLLFTLANAIGYGLMAVFVRKAYVNRSSLLD